MDLDLGNYERFLDITLHRDNNITTGKIYQTVIDRERRGDYLGKTVQGIFIDFIVYLTNKDSLDYKIILSTLYLNMRASRYIFNIW